jgi:hypothetical protein
MLRRSLFVLALVAACSASRARDPRYPRRAPGCALNVYNNLPPGRWDDLGVVQVDCYIDESDIACLSRMRTEACLMGGDIIYNVPKSALRPIERGMIYRAQVAHTHDAEKKDEAPAAADAGSGPIVVLPKASDTAAQAQTTAPSPPTDAGGQ